MNPIEYFTSLLAPHMCVVCKLEGASLCVGCALKVLKLPIGHCYRCKRPGSYICSSCTQETQIQSVYIACIYEGAAQILLRNLKFSRAKATANNIADYMHQRLPPIPENTIVTYVPTVNSRVRQRGYDQAHLIAKSFSKHRNLPCVRLLDRTKSTRQVGATRSTRFEQLENVFKTRDMSSIVGKNILIIDDVLTTGATLEAAVRTINNSCLRNVSVAVFAYKP